MDRHAALQQTTTPNRKFDASHEVADEASPPLQLRAAPGVGTTSMAAMMSGGNQSMVQLSGDGGAGDVHAAAAHGTKGGGGALPYAGQIQQAFGRHDVGGVKAHTGGAASEACDAMGAQAYASGDAVAFKGAPDLHTAAHEAAHVVQQRAGVSLKGGVGQVGDAYEQHADQVADAVVQGKSAEGLLDTMAGGGKSSRGVQQKAVQRDEGTGLTFDMVDKELGKEFAKEFKKAQIVVPLAGPVSARFKASLSLGRGGAFSFKNSTFKAQYKAKISFGGDIGVFGPNVGAGLGAAGELETGFEVSGDLAKRTWVAKLTGLKVGTSSKAFVELASYEFSITLSKGDLFEAGLVEWGSGYSHVHVQNVVILNEGLEDIVGCVLGDRPAKRGGKRGKYDIGGGVMACWLGHDKAQLVGKHKWKHSGGLLLVDFAKGTQTTTKGVHASMLGTLKQLVPERDWASTVHAHKKKWGFEPPRVTRRRDGALSVHPGDKVK